jgi:hypothetical protein
MLDPRHDGAVCEALRLVGARGRRGLQLLADPAGSAHERAGIADFYVKRQTSSQCVES